MNEHRVWLCLCVAGLPLVAHAHHSWRAVYGGGEALTVDATIVSEPFRNPHNAVHVQIENAVGEAEPWTLEWRGQRRRDGEPPVTYDLDPGDAVVVTGRRAVDTNVRKIQLERLTRTTDGMTIEARLDRNR
jgi:vancomycin resistance protein YoaR